MIALSNYGISEVDSYWQHCWDINHIFTRLHCIRIGWFCLRRVMGHCDSGIQRSNRMCTRLKDIKERWIHSRYLTITASGVWESIRMCMSGIEKEWEKQRWLLCWDLMCLLTANNYSLWIYLNFIIFYLIASCIKLLYVCFGFLLLN